MKNIHLLPTDKPSRLHFDDKLFLSTNPQISKDINSIVEGRHIYITSDEEIKHGDWYLTSKNTICKCIKTDSKYVYSLEGGSSTNCKKIILTTDQDLIKDCVQAIDDEFLEWFVKNPSCDMVEVGSYHVKGDISGKLHYKIIITKAEELPTPWFKTEQIETWIGESITTEGKEIEEIKGGRGKLIVLHQCGENKEELISQLEVMIYGLKEGFEGFAN